MLVKYKLLYKSGVKEEVLQEGSEEGLEKLHQVIKLAFEKDYEGVVSFGDGNNGRFVRVSDLSQFEMELIEDDSGIINSN